MPPALTSYWDMWNELDVDRVRHHLDRAVAPDFVFSDPVHLHRGRDALEANVRTLRTDKPEYRFVIASELDRQHDCYRYEWHMMRRHRVLLRGFDVARVRADGLLVRVDGFFGPPIPLVDTEAGSGVPARFRLASEAGAEPG